MKKYGVLLVLVTVCYNSYAQRKTYEYDNLNRLSTAHYWEGLVEKYTVTYTYDEVGNRLTKVISGSACQAPTATLSGTQTIDAGQTAYLTVTFTGGGPYSLVFNGITYSGINSGSYSVPVSPTATTTYTLTSVSNVCGAGTVSGSATIMVGNTGTGEIFSTKTGSWHDPSTWDCNCVPNNTHTVEIKASHTVTVSAADANLKDLKSSNGNLNFQNQKKLCFGCN